MALEAATYIADLVSSNPTSDDGIAQADDHMRLIKAVLLATLGGLDGPLLNGNGEPATPADFQALFQAVANLGGAVGSAGWIVDELRFYVGDVANIPAGWFIANGANGTKDMRGRMPLGDNQNPPVGTPKYDGASQGGNLPGQMTTGPAGGHGHTLNIDDHQLTAAQIPGHTHPMYVNQDGPTTNGGVNIPGANDPVAVSAPGDRDYTMVKISGTPTVGKSGSNNGSAQAVGHSGSASIVAPHTHTLDGASLPPWGAGYWIQYKGVQP